MKSNAVFDTIHGLHFFCNCHLMFLHSVITSLNTILSLLLVESTIHALDSNARDSQETMQRAIQRYSL